MPLFLKYSTNSLKTAEYTISRPLRIGAILGGAKENHLEPLLRYGYHTGLAFQLKDDELGVISPGNLRKTKNDILEGKQTFLILKALERSSNFNREFTESRLGNKKMEKDTLEHLIDELKETGAIEENNKLMLKHLHAAKEIARNELSKINSNTAEFLEKLAEYTVNRNR